MQWKKGQKMQWKKGQKMQWKKGQKMQWKKREINDKKNTRNGLYLKKTHGIGRISQIFIERAPKFFFVRALGLLIVLLLVTSISEYSLSHKTMVYATEYDSLRTVDPELSGILDRIVHNSGHYLKDPKEFVLSSDASKDYFQELGISIALVIGDYGTKTSPFPDQEKPMIWKFADGIASKKDGRQIGKSGVEQQKRTIGMSTEMKIPIGSITKTITAAMILQNLGKASTTTKKKMQFETPIQSIVQLEPKILEQQLLESATIWDQVTVENLLSHRSGIAGDQFNELYDIVTTPGNCTWPLLNTYAVLEKDLPLAITIGKDFEEKMQETIKKLGSFILKYSAILQVIKTKGTIQNQIFPRGQENLWQALIEKAETIRASYIRFSQSGISLPPKTYKRKEFIDKLKHSRYFSSANELSTPSSHLSKDLERVLDFAEKLNFEYKYNNANYIILGLALLHTADIESVNNPDFGDEKEIYDHFLKKYDLEMAFLYDMPEQELLDLPYAERHYLTMGGNLAQIKYNLCDLRKRAAKTWTAGALVTTPSDVAKWFDHLFRQGDVLGGLEEDSKLFQMVNRPEFSGKPTGKVCTEKPNYHLLGGKKTYHLGVQESWICINEIPYQFFGHSGVHSGFQGFANYWADKKISIDFQFNRWEFPINYNFKDYTDHDTFIDTSSSETETISLEELGLKDWGLAHILQKRLMECLVDINECKQEYKREF